MPTKKNVTKNQHYIPQVYLRGFSPDYLRKKEKAKPVEKYTIYRYKLGEKEQQKIAVPIKSICYEKYLYEMMDEQGQTIMPNYFECCFSELERMFGEYRKKLEAKVFVQDNFYTKCFLTEDEKIFWTTYMVFQILRVPQILHCAEENCKTIWKNEVSDIQARNIARRFTLPFLKKIKENDIEIYLFDFLWKPMKNMSFGIGVDPEGKIVTSDKTVFIYSGREEIPCEEYERVIFPISSQICLFMFGGKDKQIYNKNFLFPINEKDREEILKSMAVSAYRNLYSNHFLGREEIRYIKEVEKDRPMEVEAHVIF